MAFATMFKLTSDRLGPIGTEKRIYNFHFPVSTFGGGEKLDVMLLQALFRMFYYEFPGPSDASNLSSDPPPGSTGTIVVDGICGKQTRLHIQHFQQLLKREGITKTTDGVIDPFKKQGVFTSRTKTRYQLESLNGACLQLAVKSGDEAIHQRMIDLDKHAQDVYPTELRNALRIPVFMV